MIWILSRKESETQVLRKIERLKSGMHGDIKHLRQADVAYRLRTGDYRILFDVEGDAILYPQNWPSQERV